MKKCLKCVPLGTLFWLNAMWEYKRGDVNTLLDNYWGSRKTIPQ